MKQIRLTAFVDAETAKEVLNIKNAQVAGLPGGTVPNEELAKIGRAVVAGLRYPATLEYDINH